MNHQSTTSDDAIKKQIALRRHGTSRVSYFGPMERENCEISNTNRRHSELPQTPSALLFHFPTVACCFHDESLVGGVASELFNNLYGHGSKSIDWDFTAYHRRTLLFKGKSTHDVYPRAT